MNLPADFFAGLYRDAPRRLAHGRAAIPHASWCEAVRAKLRELLKLDPAPAVATVETVEVREIGDLLREKVVLTDPLFGPIPLFVLKPRAAAGRLPLLLALHGHGGYFAGKDLAAGNAETDPIAIECTRAMNYDYGLQLAGRGFVVAAPDAFNFGERMLAADRWSRDHVCDRYFAMLQVFGHSTAGITVRGNLMALDYLAGRPDVRDDRIGAVGLSYGGFQVLLTAAADLRIKAAAISGAAFSYGMEVAGKQATCGAQVVPGALEWFDLPDLAKSLAPRPLLFELLKQDRCFDYRDSRRIVDEVAAVYAALGAGRCFAFDEADADHSYIGREVPGFFTTHLAAS